MALLLNKLKVFHYQKASRRKNLQAFSMPQILYNHFWKISNSFLKPHINLLSVRWQLGQDIQFAVFKPSVGQSFQAMLESHTVSAFLLMEKYSCSTELTF